MSYESISIAEFLLCSCSCARSFNQPLAHLQSLRRVGEDRIVWVLCLIVFLSYLPEAGQFSSFFVYLKLIVGFSPEAVAAFIGIVGILSVFAQVSEWRFLFLAR